MERLLGKDKVELDLFELTDPAGKSATDADLDACILTRESEKGGLWMNNARKQNHLKELPFVFVDMIMVSESQSGTPEFSNKMSSSLIRNHII